MYSVIAILIATTIFAQPAVERVLILNEGYYDYLSGEILTPVSVGAYSPATGIYTELDIIEDARFASDIKIDGGFYYVAADKFLNKYDLFTNELIYSMTVEGIRKIAVNEDHIVVTRGEYLVSFDSYILVYDKNTMELEFEIDNIELNYTTEGVLIIDDIAYVAVNNGFDFGNEVGYIAKVDLIYQDLTELIDLGPEGINPDNLMIDGDNIYTLNNKDFTGSSVSAYKISTGDIGTSNLINISSGCGTSAFVNGNIYYQEMFGTTLSKYDPVTEMILSEDEFGLSFYGLTYDAINDLLYTSETDYFSYGKINIFNADGVLETSFSAGVSPGNIVFDIRTTNAIFNDEMITVTLYPNPAANVINIESAEIIHEIRITDITGNIISVANNINTFLHNVNIETLPVGNYAVAIITDNGIDTKTFVKL